MAETPLKFGNAIRSSNGEQSNVTPAPPGGNTIRAMMPSVFSGISNLVRGNDSAAAFRFVVDMDNQRLGAFTDCKLPTLSWKTQEVKEGGLNTHTHLLVGPRKKAKISFKRGVAVTAHLLAWYAEALEMRAERKRLTVTLLDTRRRPWVTWFIEDAYPIKWRGPKLQTKSKSVAVETLTLSCGRVSVQIHQ